MTGQQYLTTQAGCMHTGAQAVGQGLQTGRGAGHTGPQTAAFPKDGTATAVKRAKAVKVFFIFFSPIRF